MIKILLTFTILIDLTASCGAHDNVKEYAADSLKQAEAYKAEALAFMSGSAAESPDNFEPLAFKGSKQDGPIPNVESSNTDANELVLLEKGPSCSNKVCRGHAAKLTKVETNSSSELIIFVSFSMPDESIKNYARQAKKVGGRLIVMGLIEDSFQKTQKKLMDLGVELDIDPNQFEQHDIRKVPTIVLIQEGHEADKIVGHVSLDHALDEFASQGNVEAMKLLSGMKGRGS